MKHLKVTGEDYPPSRGLAGCCTIIRPEGKLPVAIVTIIDSQRSLDEIIGLIVHEGIHVWQLLRGCLREDNPSPEFEAYSIQTITQELILAYIDSRKLPQPKRTKYGIQVRKRSRKNTSRRKHRRG